MVARKKKKYTSGEGAQYVSRKTAMKKLQLSIKDFRKLCILKGIYPREPRNRKKAQKGTSGIQTLYHKKDIQFLMHEPIIWKFRDLKTYTKRLDKARGLKEFEKEKMLLQKHPTYQLDHIVKERYPTFIDALNDLDDCLTLCFLFSTFPSLKRVPRNQSALCQRLTLEFLHAVINAKALRKVFVSIKGYYYQAEFKGQTITWIVPHHFSFEPQHKNEVDFKIMSVFVEFYTYLLGFVNFHLYHSLNLIYPPKLTGLNQNSEEKQLVDEQAYVSERIAALNIPLCKVGDNGEQDDIATDQIDEFPMDDHDENNEKKEEIQKITTLKTLFKGLKFYINREVPREPMVFLIRSFGGLVSWDKLLFVGASYDESDESITHQVVDRASVGKQYLSRYYVQPQWLFDSVNARELLPVEKYLMGAVLPPHLSPFTNEGKTQVYMPPEERELKEPGSVKKKVLDEDNNDLGESVLEENVLEAEEETECDGEKEKTEDNEESLQEKKKKNMTVTPGSITIEDKFEDKRKEKHEFKLREKMVAKKHKKLYKSMKQGREQRKKEIWLLRKKRRLHEEAEKQKDKKVED